MERLRKIPVCFRKFMLHFEERGSAHFFNIKPTEMTTRDEQDFQWAVVTHIFHKPFDNTADTVYVKVRDHLDLYGFLPEGSYTMQDTHAPNSEDSYFPSQIPWIKWLKGKTIGQAMEKYLRVSLAGISSSRIQPCS